MAWKLGAQLIKHSLCLFNCISGQGRHQGSIMPLMSLERVQVTCPMLLYRWFVSPLMIAMKLCEKKIKSTHGPAHTRTQMIALHMWNITTHTKVRAIILGPSFTVNSKLFSCFKAFKVSPIDNFSIVFFCHFRGHAVLRINIFGIYLLNTTSYFSLHKKMETKFCFWALKFI